MGKQDSNGMVAKGIWLSYLLGPRHDRGAKFPNHAISSIIHQGDSQENNYNYLITFKR
jgi:hypothetical protein